MGILSCLHPGATRSHGKGNIDLTLCHMRNISSGFLAKPVTYKTMNSTGKKHPVKQWIEEKQNRIVNRWGEILSHTPCVTFCSLYAKHCTHRDALCHSFSPQSTQFYLTIGSYLSRPSLSIKTPTVWSNSRTMNTVHLLNSARTD